MSYWHAPIQCWGAKRTRAHPDFGSVPRTRVRVISTCGKSNEGVVRNNDNLSTIRVALDAGGRGHPRVALGHTGWVVGRLRLRERNSHSLRPCRSRPGKPVIMMAHGATDIGLCRTTLTQDM